MKKIIDNISSKYTKYKIEKIESGASKRIFYRLKKNNHSVILMDSGKEKSQYNNFIKVHNYLSKINVSIPDIYERNDNRKILLMEDFGNKRFDKIYTNYDFKKIFLTAVQTLVTIQNEIHYKSDYNLKKYNFKIFLSEISEFLDYYYPFIYNKKISKSFKEDFLSCWKNQFKKIKFNFNSFVHKDFNINNLMYLNSRKKHLKCGILDFQNAFWGENCWDLFSLLEDSRMLFDSQYNEYFINYYYNNTRQESSNNEFKIKYYMLSTSRQTRLMGRWIKLSKNLKNDFYLKFIPVTKKRLIDNMKKLDNKELMSMYFKIISDY
tara:strand:- start:247 stop:1209 length:963 start_codon:yes stop_codon:yes gene_type:complete